MGRQQSPDNLIRQKRLKRRKIILTIWDWIQSFFNWVKCAITFKMCIVVYCIWYVTDIIEYWKEQNALGNYVDSTVIIAVITAFIVELGLTALSSHRQNKKYEDYESEDENYG